MQKFNYSDAIVHAVYAHHEAEECRTVEAMIVKAADAISAGRPGARQESIERYVERLRALEDIAASQNGVKKTFAISAGRELRVIVEPEIVKDLDMTPLAKTIAEQVEGKLSYPGKIKINIIRKTQATDYAK
jgi:ribonucrease Y